MQLGTGGNFSVFLRAGGDRYLSWGPLSFAIAATATTAAGAEEAKEDSMPLPQWRELARIHYCSTACRKMGVAFLELLLAFCCSSSTLLLIPL